MYYTVCKLMPHVYKWNCTPTTKIVKLIYDYTTKFIIEHKSRVSVVPSKDGPVKSYFTTSKGYWRLIITWIPKGKYFRFHSEIVRDTLKIFSRTLVLPWTILKQSSKKKKIVVLKRSGKKEIGFNIVIITCLFK